VDRELIFQSNDSYLSNPEVNSRYLFLDFLAKVINCRRSTDMAMAARDSATTRGRNNTNHKKKGDKKQCELGASCPYRDQYQHSLEFTHGNDEPSAPDSTAASRSFHAFSGAGHSMASTMTNRSSRAPSTFAAGGTQSAAAAATAAAMRRASAATTTAHQHSQRRQSSHLEVIFLDDSDDDEIEQQNTSSFQNVDLTTSPKKRPARSASSPLVDLCDDSSEEEDDDVREQLPRHRSGAPVAKRNRVETMRNSDVRHRPSIHNGGIRCNAPSDSSGLDYTPSSIAATSAQDEESHLARAIAASNRDITSEQDQEYSESLRQDEEKERAKRAEEQNKKEEEEFQKALEESSRLAEEEKQSARERERQHYVAQLEPEPTYKKDCVTVAFRLPSRCSKNRIERKFHIDAGADQLLAFLHGCKELQDISEWTLREVLGGKEIEADKSLRDLELVPRGMVVVWDEGS
jgi:hypothetical protein